MVRKAAMFCILATLVFAVMSCSEKPNTEENVNNNATVTILTPWNNTMREGVVEVKVDAVDLEGISHVEAYAGDRSLGKITAEPYVFSWDTSTIPDGTVTKIVAKVVDLSGAETSSAAVSVTKGATTTPVVAISSPTGSVTISQGEAVTFKGSATDADSTLPFSETNCTWTSNLQGDIQPNIYQHQTPDNFQFRGLVVGVHEITLTVMNKDGVPGKATAHVTVNENTGKFAYVSAGKYAIAQPNFAKSTVTISRPLWVAKKEVTVQEFLDFGLIAMGDKLDGLKKSFVTKRNKELAASSNGTPLFPALYTIEKDSPLTAQYANYPATFITFQEACVICNAMSQKAGLKPAYQLLGSDGKGLATLDLGTKVKSIVFDQEANGYRMLTEAEWEIAARGGLTGMKYPWGDREAPGNANTMSDPLLSSPLDFYQGRGIVPVGSYQANAYGLYDMAGNVAEMTSDMYVGRVPSGFDPVGFEPIKLANSRYLVKGGSWDGYLADSQVSIRRYSIPATQTAIESYCNFIGFRVARYAE